MLLALFYSGLLGIRNKRCTAEFCSETELPFVKCFTIPLVEDGRVTSIILMKWPKLVLVCQNIDGWLICDNSGWLAGHGLVMTL